MLLGDFIFPFRVRSKKVETIYIYGCFFLLISLALSMWNYFRFWFIMDLIPEIWDLPSCSFAKWKIKPFVQWWIPQWISHCRVKDAYINTLFLYGEYIEVPANHQKISFLCSLYGKSLWVFPFGISTNADVVQSYIFSIDYFNFIWRFWSVSRAFSRVCFTQIHRHVDEREKKMCNRVTAHAYTRARIHRHPVVLIFTRRIHF